MLKKTSFLTLEEAVDWLKLDRKQAGIEGDTKATAVLGDIKFTAALYGTDGNGVQVVFANTATAAGAETLALVGHVLTVGIKAGISTATQVLAALAASQEALRVVTAVLNTGGNAGNPQVAGTATLANGAYHTTYKTTIKPFIERFIDGACDFIEKKIGGPVLCRQFTELHDVAATNVFVPHYYPITAIVELKVDYNRRFDNTAEDPANYFIRGGADLRQVTSDATLRVLGTDVVLYYDNTQVVVGKLTDRAPGAMRITYLAGWGNTIADLPTDLTTAALQLVEYWWLQRENRDINVSSKGVRGESYTKLKDGVPESILEMLEGYEDGSLGARPLMQGN